MSVALPFVKASACGNDFLIVEGAHAVSDLATLTRQLCDRHDGVGADGVEWIYPAEDADIRARLINADGSDAEISGNGTRCVAAHYIRERGGVRVAVHTDAGIKSCTLITHADATYEFEMEMGEPQPGDPFSIWLAFGEVTGTPVSTGNPHFVLLVDEFPPDWQARAAEIGKHRAFPHGANVEFVRVHDRHHIEIRIFERGAGETLSSGTGSSAAAVAAIASARADSPVLVQSPGGAQTVRWDGQLYLRGPARLLCRGEFFL
jgi:diaminopimelate epimerase